MHSALLVNFLTLCIVDVISIPLCLVFDQFIQAHTKMLNLIFAFSLVHYLIFNTTMGISVVGRDLCIAKCEDCTINNSINVKCGSDGVTYINECELNCATKKCNSTLHALHDGVCSSLLGLNIEHQSLPESGSIIVTAKTTEASKKIEACDPFDDCTCNLDLLHICGTDGTTYPNECVLKCATKCNADLKVFHYGPCY